MDMLGLTLAQWREVGVSALIILAAVTLGRWIVALLVDRLAVRLVGRTRTSLDNAILAVIRPLVYWLLVLAALNVAIGRLDFLPVSWQAALPDAFFALYFIVGFAIIYRVVDELTKWYGERLEALTDERAGRQWMPFVRRALLFVLGAIGLITLLGRFGVDISALVATLGVGSLAIALAAQASLSDIISGIIIMIDQPYRVGDRIEILDLDTWGDVVDLGLRSTRVRTRDNRMVIVPNSVIGKSLVVNHAFPDSQYRIQVEVGLAYGTDLEKARSTIIEAVQDVEGVQPDRPVDALFLAFGESSLNFRVRWWIDSYIDTRRMFDKVNSAMYDALNRAGIAFSTPQRELHHRVDPDTLRGAMQVIRSGAAGD